MADRNVLDSNQQSELGATADRKHRSIGPSDSSDAGSDLAGVARTEDSDRGGTGERLSAGDDAGTGSDIGFDRVVGSDEAGLGGGLDQAEEAIAGTTDEEIAERARRGR